MLLYRFLNTEFAIKSVRERRLKASRINELNDPFEFLGVDLSCPEQRLALHKTKNAVSEKYGLICFSKSWRNPVLWGHYADSHKGICLGFEMPDGLPSKVSYVDSRFEWPAQMDEDFMMRLLLTKFIHWSYEDEHRVYVSLTESENGLYFYDFSKDLKLRRLIVGSESSVSRKEVMDALGNLSCEVEVFKASAASSSFEVERNSNESLWV